MTWLLLVLVLVGACWLAVTLLQRLYDAQAKLGSLHEELHRNDLDLQRKIQNLKDKNAEKRDTENAE